MLKYIAIPFQKKKSIVEEGSSGGIEQDEKVSTWKKKYSSWNEFWKKFTSDSNWFYFYPVFIHPEVRDVVKKDLIKLKANEAYSEHKRRNWERAVEIISRIV